MGRFLHQIEQYKQIGIKMNVPIYVAMICFVIFSGCAENKGFNDGGASGTKEPVVLEQPEPKEPEPPLFSENAEPDITFEEPEDIVDGQEVFNSCGKCVNRAKILSSTIGFEADESNAIDMGFHKIDPSKNLCDIHFLASLNVRIDEHDGVDTIGNNQIILYCPCNCGWLKASQFAPFISLQ